MAQNKNQNKTPKFVQGRAVKAEIGGPVIEGTLYIRSTGERIIEPIKADAKLLQITVDPDILTVDSNKIVIVGETGQAKSVLAERFLGADTKRQPYPYVKPQKPLNRSNDEEELRKKLEAQIRSELEIKIREEIEQQMYEEYLNYEKTIETLFDTEDSNIKGARATMAQLRKEMKAAQA